eukprot:66658_1
MMLTNIKYGKSKYIRKHNNKHKRNKKFKTKHKYKKISNLNDKYKNKKAKKHCNSIDFKLECLNHTFNDTTQIDILNEVDESNIIQSIPYPYIVDLNVKTNVCHVCQLVKGGIFFNSSDTRLKRYKLTTERCVDCYIHNDCRCVHPLRGLVGCKDSLNDYRCKHCYFKWYPNMISDIIEQVISISLAKDLINILCDYCGYTKGIKCNLYYKIERLYDNKLIYTEERSVCNPFTLQDCKSICMKNYRIDNSIFIQPDLDVSYLDYGYDDRYKSELDYDDYYDYSYCQGQDYDLYTVCLEYLYDYYVSFNHSDYCKCNYCRGDRLDWFDDYYWTSCISCHRYYPVYNGLEDFRNDYCKCNYCRGDRLDGLEDFRNDDGDFISETNTNDSLDTFDDYYESNWYNKKLKHKKRHKSIRDKRKINKVTNRKRKNDIKRNQKAKNKVINAYCKQSSKYID